MDKERLLHPFAYSKEQVLMMVQALEVESSDLALNALANSEVTVGIIDNYPVHNLLPKELLELFVAIGNKATSATAINVGLRYDKIKQFFIPTAAAIKLDNLAVIEFSQSRRMADMDAFYMQILGSGGEPLVTPPIYSTFGTYSTDEMESILKSVGLELPNHQQPAEWSAIGHILGSSKKWQTTIEQTIPLTPERHVLVRDTVDGGMYDIADDVESLLDPHEIWQRSLTIGVDSAKKDNLLPNSSLQLSLKSDNPFEIPKYDAISRVPIQYIEEDFAPFVPEFIEHLSSVRTELEDKRKTVKPNPDLLNSLRQAVLEARILTEVS